MLQTKGLAAGLATALAKGKFALDPEAKAGIIVPVFQDVVVDNGDGDGTRSSLKFASANLAQICVDIVQVSIAQPVEVYNETLENSLFRVLKSPHEL